MVKSIRAGVRDLRFATLAGCALASLLVSLPAHAADTASASSCKRTADEKSVFMRALQTDLMVAALTCNSSDQYNSFIHQFQPVLIKDNKTLAAYFKKRHGKSGTTEMNAFVTHLANDESQRSIAEGTAQYCDDSGKLITAALAEPSDKIEEFSTEQVTLAADAPVKLCAGAAKSSPAAAPVKTQPAAIVAPVPATSPAPDATPAPAVAK